MKDIEDDFWDILNSPTIVYIK